VQLTLPDLVEAIEPRARTPLHQLIKACRGGIENHRAHRQEAYRPASRRFVSNAPRTSESKRAESNGLHLSPAALSGS
jgi:hypothetical protein